MALGGNEATHLSSLFTAFSSSAVPLPHHTIPLLTCLVPRSARWAQVGATPGWHMYHMQLVPAEIRSRCPMEITDSYNSKFKSVRGIVTYLCTDYGWINETIFFNPDMVCGNVPVNVGMSVIALVEEDETTHALKTIKVKTMSDPIYGIEPSEFDKRLCIKCVTYATRDSIYISKETFFPMQLLSGGFLPFKGDLLLVEYSLKPGTSNITIHTVSLLNSQNMDEVCVTSVDGRTGVVDDIIYFTLDSLQKPTGYTPGLYDIVNVVAVDSVQQHCSWRAVSMIPVEMCIDQAS
ncbi:cancer/testis antigen 55-like [Cricetulus griseus]|uniref:cancer/testis antigen 55-like n=1 Tax=Cricetulus griseus TaxID=10029 RepID=UPI0015C2F937|nr:cancer/testis antigen 55-like [Cricetulus griseus]